MNKTFIIICNKSLEEGGGFATVSITADEQDLAWLERLAREEIEVILAIEDKDNAPLGLGEDTNAP